jgi:hypothetical protein
MRQTWILSFVTAILFACAGGTAAAQTKAPGDSVQTVPVSLTLKGIGKTEIDALIRGERVYVPFTATFKFLRLNYNYNAATGVANGFYIRSDNSYRIDPGAGTASAGSTRAGLSQDDFIVRTADLYLRLELYETLFGLQLKYNPRRLEIVLQTKEALPIFLERAREYARRRKLLLGNIPKPEYVEARAFSAFNAGRLDYSFSTQFTQHGFPRRDYSLRLGNQFLGGDLDTRFEGSSSHSPTWNDLTSRLRYAFLTDGPVKQVNLGDIITTGLVPSSVLGAEITNRPAPIRLLFVTQTLEGDLQSGELSDLYYGGSLVDFQAGSAAGKYTFPALITYGVTDYQVKRYDQFGVERDIQYRIVVPPTMIPPGEVQYSLAGGKNRLQNDEGYGNGVVQWGVNDALTVGGGFDYYSPTSFVVNQKFHPMLTATGRISGTLIGDFVFSPTAYSRGLISLSYPSSAGASLGYTWFARNPFYNPRNINNEATATLTVPVRPGGARLGLDLVGRQTLFASGRERIFQASLGGQIGIVAPRITHRRSYTLNPVGETTLEAITNASLAIRAPANFLLRGQTNYFHTDGGFRNLRIDFSKRFSKEFWIEFFYDRTFEISNSITGVQLLYYFPFALVRAIVGSNSQGGLQTSEGVSGSVGYSAAAGRFFLDYLSSRVGFGGVIVQPYVDANANGIRDPGEEIVTKARIRSSSLFGNQYLHYTPGMGFGLAHTLPYEEYVMTIDPLSLDNPLWVPKYENIGVFSEPNLFRQVDLPIVVGGIIRGKIELQSGAKTVAGEGLTVMLTEEGSSGEKKVFTNKAVAYSTGEYEFIGVPPGSYRVSLDAAQVAQSGYQARELSRVVQVQAKPDGDEVAGVDFLLTK